MIRTARTTDRIDDVATQVMTDKGMIDYRAFTDEGTAALIGEYLAVLAEGR